MHRALALALVAVAALCACEGCGEGALSGLSALITPSADTHDFGARYVGSFTDASVGLRSSGTTTLRLDRVAVEGQAFALAEAVEAAALGPGATLEVGVSFAPLASGAFSGELVVESDADNAPELRVALVGTALPPLGCDDGNPCTTDSFDPDEGACTNVARDGACDDENLCTEDDRCAEGVCVGVALVCAAEDLCSVGVCAAQEGCISFPDPDACADDNPCTADLCDPVLGCSHETVPDGTPCPPGINGCAEANVCLAGTCTAVAVPDGVPCNDGDFCTVTDTCFEGACVGTRVEREPEVVGAAYLWGANSAKPAVLPDGRVVIWDQPLVTASAGLVRVVNEVFGRLQAGPVLRVPAAGRRAWLEPVDATHVLALADDAGADAHVLAVAATGEVTVRSTVTLPWELRGHVVVHGQRAYACGAEGGGAATLRVLDLADLDAPAELSSPGLPCVDVALDRVRDRLLLATSAGLEARDLLNAALPLLASVSLSDVARVVVTPDAVVALHLVEPTGYNLRSVVFDAELVSGTQLLAEDAAQDLQVVDAGLVVERRAGDDGPPGLELWDVTEPAAPTRLGVQPPADSVSWTLGGLVAGADLVVDVDAEWQFWRVTPDAPYAFSALTGAGHGTVQRLADNGAVHALSWRGAHRVELDPAGAPQLSAGSRHATFALVKSLGPAGGAPLVLLPAPPNSPPADGTITSGTLFTWTDAADPTYQLVVGSRRFAAPHTSRSARAEGRFLISYAPGAVPRLFLTDLQLEQPSFDAPFVEAGSVQLPAGAGGHPRVLALHAASRRALVAHRVTDVTAHVIDFSDLAAPEVVASHSYPADAALLRSGAVAGDRVVLLEDERLSVFDVEDDGTLSASGVLTDPPGHAVLLFDGANLVARGVDRLTFLDVTVAPPAVVGEVVLDDLVTDALVRGDRLMVAGHQSVAVLEPPCPPL